MPNKAWKAFERYIAKVLGGVRRGPGVRGDSGGKNDIIHDHWSAECKLYAAPSYSVILNACRQAEENRDHDMQCPVAFVKRKNALNKDTLVCMRLEEWEKWYGSFSYCGPEGVRHE